MLLPDNFENEISSRFYDKEITVLETRERIEADGGVIREDNVVKKHFSEMCVLTRRIYSKAK